MDLKLIEKYIKDLGIANFGGLNLTGRDKTCLLKKLPAPFRAGSFFRIMIQVYIKSNPISSLKYLPSK